MDPLTALLVPARSVGSALVKKAENHGIDIIIRQAVPTISDLTYLVRGPKLPRIAINESGPPAVGSGVASWGCFLQTAHTPGSNAANFLADDRCFANFLQVANDFEEIQSRTDDSKIRHAYSSGHLALGLYYAIRFGDKLQKASSISAGSRAQELLNLADRLIDSTEGFSTSKSVYESTRAVGLDANCVEQLLSECTISRAIAHRRLGSSIWANSYEAEAEADVWKLTRINGDVIRALLRNGLGDDVNDALNRARDAARIIKPKANSLNHRFMLHGAAPEFKAAQGVQFARGYTAVLEAAIRLLESWHKTHLTRRERFAIGWDIFRARHRYEDGGHLWWHSYANVYLVWGLFRYRLGDYTVFQKALDRAREIYRRTHDTMKEQKIACALAVSRQHRVIGSAEALALLF